MRLLLVFFLLIPYYAQATISLVSASTDFSASETSIAPAEPASAAENDLFVGFAWIDSEDGTWSCPTSWTEIDNQTQAAGTGHSVVCYIKRGASEPNLTFSYSGTADGIRATIYAWRGQDTSTPFDVTYSSGSHYSQTENTPTAACAAITTASANAVVTLLQQNEFSASGTPGAPSGFTLDSTGDGNVAQHNMAYLTQASADTVTPGVWTHSGFNSGDDPQCYTLAIKVASAGIDYALYRRCR